MGTPVGMRGDFDRIMLIHYLPMLSIREPQEGRS
jgi:hypothetical protein